MSGDNGYAYVGIKPCGCMVFAFVDRPEHKRDIAKEVAVCIRSGWTVERVPVERVRAELKTCRCEEEKK